jgi:DNA repair protein RecO (recombination protein O)
MADTATASTSVTPGRSRRTGEARVDHQPGVVLHTTAWRETSLIVEVFTRDYGRMALVARGAKRPTSQYRGMLSPFAPLALSWSGRNDIKNLVRVEWIGGLAPLRGNALLAAFYANELVVRLLARADAHEHLFASYLELLGSLRGERLDAALRTFELDLLREIGYAVPLDRAPPGLAQAALGRDAGPALVERVDRNPGLLRQRRRERPRGLRLRPRAPAHVQRQSDDRATDPTRAHQFAERGKVSALALPLERARRKRDATVLVGDGKPDPARTEVDAEHSHGAQPSS